MTDAIHNMGQFLVSQAQAIQKSAEAKVHGKHSQDLKKACQGFESLFVNYLMQQMRTTVPQSGLLGGSQAEKLYTGMLDSEVSKTVTKERGIGLARIMYEQMQAIKNAGEIKK